jgi:hypothetical protein
LKNRSRLHIDILEEDHLFLTNIKLGRNEPFYKVLNRLITRYQELEYINQQLREALEEKRS